MAKATNPVPGSSLDYTHNFLSVTFTSCCIILVVSKFSAEALEWLRWSAKETKGVLKIKSGGISPYAIQQTTI